MLIATIFTSLTSLCIVNSKISLATSFHYLI